MIEYNSKIFFILGCQRSGTTLTRLILDSHKEIHCFDEYKSYDVLSNKKSFQENIELYKDKNSIGFKTPVYTEQFDKSLLQDWMKRRKVTNEFQECKIIFVYRDTRDVVSSIKKHIEKNGKNWLIPIFDFWNKEFPELQNEYEKEFSIIHKYNNEVVPLSALYWKIKNSYMKKYKLQGKKIIGVRYENLCNDPKKEIKKMVDFLEIKWDDGLLAHQSILHDEVNVNGLTVGNVDATKPINNDAIGKYQNNLTSDELDKILQITGDLMSELEYPF